MTETLYNCMKISEYIYIDKQLRYPISFQGLFWWLAAFTHVSSFQRSPKVKKLFPLEREVRHHLLNYTLAAVTANLIRFLLHSVIHFITSISAGLIPSNISAYPPAMPFATQDDTSLILLYWTTEQPSLFQMLWTGGREDESPVQFCFKATTALLEV